jgi:asparaginyl-tRNA synthetase
MHTIAQLADAVGAEVTLRGWLFNKRSSGKIHFLQLRDGSGRVQGVAVQGEADAATIDLIDTLTLESSVAVTGTVRADKRSPSGVEITVKRVELIHLAEEYPIGKKEHGVDFLLDHRHLWVRSERQWAILRIRDELERGIQDFYAQEGFLKFDCPEITPSACEGTTTLFEIDYFGDPAYLSQSGQLYLEAGIMSFGRVYDFQPVFRAEKSKTRRHLIEFWMTDAEAAFVDHAENMRIQERMVAYLIDRVLTNRLQELQIIERDIEPLKKVKAPFDRMTYDEAVVELQKLGSDIKWGEDFGNDDETILMNAHEKPLFVEKFPTAIKAFYMLKDPDNPKVVMGNDLLAPEGYGEIIGGSQREHDYDELKRMIEKHKLPLGAFDWYLDLRRYGSVPHSGFGLGLERVLAWVCGLPHVRETIPFPRLLNRFQP